MGRHLTAVAGLALTAWILFGYAAHPNTLIMLDVGQGLSELYTDPSGWQLLYDGGPGGITTAALGRVLPIWDQYLDVVALSHPHADHSAGLVTILDRYRVGELWLTAPASPDQATQQILQLAAQRHIPIKLIARGTTVVTPGNTTLVALTPVAPFTTDPPPHPHAATPVIVITSANSQTVLLTGDLDLEDEKSLLAFCSVSVLCPSAVSVLQVAHHGSKYVTSTAFLRRFHPKVALISAGVGNIYHHPHRETLDRLTVAGSTIKRTDVLGTIVQRLDRGG